MIMPPIGRGMRLHSSEAAASRRLERRKLKACSEAASPSTKHELDNAADRAVECARLASQAASDAAAEAARAAQFIRDLISGALDNAADRRRVCAAGRPAASEAAKAALAAKQCRDAVASALDDAADRAVETARLAPGRRTPRMPLHKQLQDARDALDEFDRAEELLRQAQEEEDEQTWLSDLAKPDEEARPKTAPRSPWSTITRKWPRRSSRPPVHYKKKQQKNFLYEVFSNAPFCSHLI